MSNTRHLNWHGSPLIRALGTTFLFLSLVSVPVASHAQNLGKQPATGQAVQGQQASQPEGAFLNLVDWIGNVICPVGAVSPSWAVSFAGGRAGATCRGL